MFKKWDIFMTEGDKALLDTVLTFEHMDKGTMYYVGYLEDGTKVHCSVSEAYIGDYCYAAKEKVSSVTQGEYVYLTVDGKAVFNNH